MERTGKMSSHFNRFRRKQRWQKQRRVYFSAKIAGMKKINGWVNARCVKSGTLL